jgi:hypothetical protein|tara:strand:+ start:218 stop:466 length:249 start_codon:yes stop_codon:yes gene_type:complete
MIDRDYETKYVVFEYFSEEFIIIFPETLTHAELASGVTKMSKYMNPISGGFIEHGKCVGESISLDMKSRGDTDTLLLKGLMK